MATKYILDPSGKIIKADSGEKIDLVENKSYINETLKNISAEENDENDNVFDSFLSNVRLGLLEGESDQDRLTRYITSKVDQDPSFGFIDKDGKTKISPDQVDSFKPFNSFINTNKVFADEFEMLTGFRLRTNEFDESIQTTLLMFSYFAELVAKFATVEAIVLLNHVAEGEKSTQAYAKGQINNKIKSLRLGRYDFTEYDILTKYVYNVLNYPHDSSNFNERIMAYFIGFTEWISPDIVFDYNKLLSSDNALDSASSLFGISERKSFFDFFDSLGHNITVAITSLVEIIVAASLNHTSINRVRLLLRKFYQERLFKQRNLYKAKPQNQFTESFVIPETDVAVPSIDILGFFDDLNYYYFKFMIERIQVGLPILFKYFYKGNEFNSEKIIFNSSFIDSTSEKPKYRISAYKMKNSYLTEIRGEPDSRGNRESLYKHVTSGEGLKSPTRLSVLPQYFLNSNVHEETLKRMGSTSVIVSDPEVTQNFNEKKRTDLRRLNINVVNELEEKLESEYMPFYIHDVRTNELISFHAFIESISDSFSPEYNSSSGFGRIDDVKTYVKTTRNINLTFIVAATSKSDHDLMWYQVNKIVSMVYPQWSDGFMASVSETRKYNESEENSDSFNLKFPFRYPFTQVPTASPLIRLRVGDVIKSNYSRENLARLHGTGEDVTEIGNINYDKFSSIKNLKENLEQSRRDYQDLVKQFDVKLKELKTANEQARKEGLSDADAQLASAKSESAAAFMDILKHDTIGLNEEAISSYINERKDAHKELARNRLGSDQFEGVSGHIDQAQVFIDAAISRQANAKEAYAQQLQYLNVWKSRFKEPNFAQKYHQKRGFKTFTKWPSNINAPGTRRSERYKMIEGHPRYGGLLRIPDESVLSKKIAENKRSLDATIKAEQEKIDKLKIIQAEYAKVENQILEQLENEAKIIEQERFNNVRLTKEQRLIAANEQVDVALENRRKINKQYDKLDLEEIIKLGDEYHFYNKNKKEEIASNESKYKTAVSEKTTALQEEVKNETYEKIINRRSEGKVNNPITISYESGMSRGLAGFITNLDINYNDSTWEIDKGSRAPMLVKINIGFSPIHDIPPGLDHHGAMRAPVYNVGQINNKFFGDPIMTNKRFNYKKEDK